MTVYAFGCVFGSDSGHRLIDEQKQTLQTAGPWGDMGNLDGTLCPPTSRSLVQALGGIREAQVQGRARLHHKDGWTAIAFWDRTGDSRPGSNTAFLIDADLDFYAALTAAREAFPNLFDRFTFEVVPA